jgi:RNAse (barnase) inhibitor barstar
MNPPESFYRTINDPPLIFMPEDEANDFVEGLQCGPAGGAVRVIRGRKCRDYAALHNEVAAALQFPGYYGENWDAMDECVTDLEWMPAPWYLIHVNGIERLLPDDEKGFGIFLGILDDAGRRWADPDSRGLASNEARLRRPFHTIISGSEEGLRRARAALGR